MPSDFKQFLNAYMEAAFWTSQDELKNKRTGGFCTKKQLSADALEKMTYDCMSFFDTWSSVWQNQYVGSFVDIEISIENVMAGHDFWLTRNREGAGFWDGDWASPAANRLSEAAHKYGECNLYLGDDRKIYIS